MNFDCMKSLYNSHATEKIRVNRCLQAEITLTPALS